MTDILLTHSFFIHFDPKQEQAMMPYPPLGTLYAASYLESKNFSVRFFDTMLAASEEEIHTALQTHRPKLLAIYDDDFNYLNKMCLMRMREAAFGMTRIAKALGVFVVIHGSDAADHYERYLNNGADIVIIGEGEHTLFEVCDHKLRNNNDDFFDIAGVAFTRHGKIERTTKRDVLKNLDALPMPAWHLIEAKKYRDAWMKRHGYFSVNIVTTRGCPYHCNWCAKPIYGQVYNARSPENVVAEMQYILDLVQPDHFWFADDIFGLKPGWVQQFAALLKENNIAVRFKIQSRADLLLQGNTIESLAAAGCDEVWIGAESGSQKILDAMEKGITLQQIYEARRKLKQFGIKTAFFLQFGYRAETMDDIRATIHMVKKSMPDDIGISVSYPLPGTSFYEKVKSELKEKQNWIDSNDLAMMYHGTYSAAFYKRLHRYVHRIFRIHRAAEIVKKIFLFQQLPTKKDIRRILSLGLHLPGVCIDYLRLTSLAKQ